MYAGGVRPPALPPSREPGAAESTQTTPKSTPKPGLHQEPEKRYGAVAVQEKSIRHCGIEETQHDDMSITSPFLRIAGRGNVQFLNEVLGYAVTAHLVDSCEGQGRGLVEDLLDVPIPIRITGPIRKPRFGFDFDRLIESLAQKQIEKQGSRLIEKALGGNRSGGTSSGKGEDVIKGLLKGLFK